MAGLQDIATRLQSAPVATFHVTVVRCRRPHPAHIARNPRLLVHVGQGKPFQPRGCCLRLLFGGRENRASGVRKATRSSGPQPVGTFFAEARLTKVRDLADPKTRVVLGLSAKDLRVAWPLARRPTLTQLLGLAFTQQADISAIRFESDAARAAGFAGFNVVIFRDCVRAPDYVKILGPTKKPLDQWP